MHSASLSKAKVVYPGCFLCLRKAYLMSFLASVSIQLLFVFFFNDTATTEIYTLSLHDALPILPAAMDSSTHPRTSFREVQRMTRSEEHTSELQSRRDLVCRLLLEKKNKNNYPHLDILTNTGILTSRGPRELN